MSPAHAAPRFSMLVFSKVNGFVHDTIPAGQAAIHSLGTANNFAVTVSDDANLFTDAGLVPSQAVIFNNTNGRDGATINPLEVDLPRERRYAEVMSDSRFDRLSGEIRSLLGSGV